MASAWQRALVVGASSGMGEAIARQLAREGCQVALVARRKDELARLADEINTAAGTTLAHVYPHDVREYECVPALFQQICHDLGGLDLIIYAAGVMPRIADNEYSFDKDRLMFEVNTLGAIAWLNEAAQRFERAGAGTIVGISSVAGDRGRRGQPAYCASKAALATYLESLRNRIGRHGVKVVTVKPGPVDTPMTKGLDKLPMLIPAEKAAAGILAAARAGVHTAYVPGAWRPIMFVIRSIPSFLFKKLNI
ncbi:MAG TPA: SDR family NAD(P)-dependent oxidoreductase [Chthonomonadaceae bacterium]|nr:SDR family NAD(P)-dependent oxidoreductase [Chthonomonadaceae bacterium]